MSEEITVDQQLRIKAVEMAFPLWLSAQDRGLSLLELLTETYEFIKGETK
jgi:hypothetical protein